MNKEKLRSFIKLCQRGCVSNVNLIEQFDYFMRNTFYDDAYEYYASLGMIQTETISKVKICRWIMEEHEENPSTSLNGLIGGVMKRSAGRLDPNTVKDIVNEYFS
jgi:Asp-tRNA(Asn)/Glu-tRNA(Gln) amidotransferase B subunit